MAKEFSLFFIMFISSTSKGVFHIRYGTTRFPDLAGLAASLAVFLQTTALTDSLSSLVPGLVCLNEN